MRLRDRRGPLTAIVMALAISVSRVGVLQMAIGRMDVAARSATKSALFGSNLPASCGEGECGRVYRASL